MIATVCPVPSVPAGNSYKLATCGAVSGTAAGAAGPPLASTVSGVAVSGSPSPASPSPASPSVRGGRLRGHRLRGHRLRRGVSGVTVSAGVDGLRAWLSPA